MNKLSKGNREYENWNGSRWDFTKRRSAWHFDTTRPPEPGKDSYTYVCRFDADFTEAIKQCLPRTVESTWATRNNFDKLPTEPKKRMYSANEEEADLIRAGADPHMKIFNRAAAEDIEIFQQVSNYIGMDDCYIKFHNQTTGQMLVEHIDNFAGRQERANSFKVTRLDKHPEVIRRFAIMLDDWKLGQVFQLGNATWTQWRAGDCITWEWQNIPHATCNMGWEDRPMLQLTGYVTEQTNKVLSQAGADQIVKL